jgi:hypothetical protein
MAVAIEISPNGAVDGGERRKGRAPDVCERAASAVLEQLALAGGASKEKIGIAVAVVVGPKP